MLIAKGGKVEYSPSVSPSEVLTMPSGHLGQIITGTFVVSIEVM